jgi:hypothetical protein
MPRPHAQGRSTITLPEPTKAIRDRDHDLEVFRGKRLPWRTNAIVCRQIASFH